MELVEIHPLLVEQFPEATVTMPSPSTWQVEWSEARLLAIASDDLVWLRLLLPLAPQNEAQPYLEALLEANFEVTHSVYYALHQSVLWAVSSHRLAALTPESLISAIQQTQNLQQTWLRDVFLQATEKQIRQIIRAAKQQGQSLEATLQNIGRFYEEGILGGLEQTAQERETVMAAWQMRLAQLWDDG
ncbi:MAG: hypothetical protein F6J87_30320 [Spirulina sp. SIO3F2]|nr:hypothetical protein [Spirulina sp. SIO3F2]